MRLTFKKFDARACKHEPILDRDTGKKVGYIYANGVGPYDGGIQVSLFDEKYRASFNRFDEVFGFVQVVEAVLNYVTPRLTHFTSQLTDAGEPVKRDKQTADLLDARAIGQPS
jgi:hypothetical protein